MKKVFIYIFLLAISFACGIIFCNLTSKFKGKILFFNSSVSYSVNTVRQKCSIMGIELPQQAWDVDFLWKESGPDSYCFIAFSASPKDIDETIAKLKATASQKHIEFSIPTPVDDEGQVLDWWPSNTLNKLNVQKGTFYWSGYDIQNSRVYIYKFTQ
ncbi:MAG: hypothetical protein PHS31_06780 [Victivallaceae bacterium]|nr:hypothetical protein [Victivallaceae bacterium]